MNFISVGTLACDEGSILQGPRESPQTHIERRQMAKKREKNNMNAKLILHCLLINKMNQEYKQCVSFIAGNACKLALSPLNGRKEHLSQQL